MGYAASAMMVCVCVCADFDTTYSYCQVVRHKNISIHGNAQGGLPESIFIMIPSTVKKKKLSMNIPLWSMVPWRRKEEVCFWLNLILPPDLLEEWSACGFRQQHRCSVETLACGIHLLSGKMEKKPLKGWSMHWPPTPCWLFYLLCLTQKWFSGATTSLFLYGDSRKP